MKRCENCQHCEYIGEGDYYCDCTQSIVITDFTDSTEDYLGCHGIYYLED